MKKEENTIILNEDIKDQILDIFSDVVNDNNCYSTGLWIDEDDVCYGDVYQILFKSIPTDLYVMCEWTRTGTSAMGYGYTYDEPYIVKKEIIIVEKIDWNSV